MSYSPRRSRLWAVGAIACAIVSISVVTTSLTYRAGAASTAHAAATSSGVKHVTPAHRVGPLPGQGSARDFVPFGPTMPISARMPRAGLTENDVVQDWCNTRTHQMWVMTVAPTSGFSGSADNITFIPSPGQSCR